MSYLLCLSVPAETEPLVRSCFNAEVHCLEIDNYRIAEATRKDASWRSYRLIWRGHSEGLVFKYVDRTSRDKRPLLVEGVEKVINTRTCWAASLVGHWFTGSFETEEVNVLREVKLTPDEFPEAVEHFEDDVRYVVRGLIPRFPWQTGWPEYW